MTANSFVLRRHGAFPGAVWFALLLGLLPPTARRASAEAMLQLFNLSWNEVAAKIPEIAEAGYTSLWLPPPTKANSGNSVVTRFTDTLTADVKLFSIFIDGAFQERTNGNGVAYAFNDQTLGDGKNELRFGWHGMNAGQHLIEAHYTGDGLAIEATRVARVALTGVADTDGDGLPDFWETQNGLSPTNSAGLDGAAGDPDGDGFSNLEEYLAGTDPWDGDSLLKIIDLAGAGRVITWNSIPGRNYQVFAATNVNGASTVRSGTLTAFTSPMSFTNPAPVRPHEFYRVLVFP